MLNQHSFSLYIKKLHVVYLFIVEISPGFISDTAWDEVENWGVEEVGCSEQDDYESAGKRTF